ncbi:MAG: bifunctional precorrin-2 dehydrogenase/sirohydrochlorin ferrochelatase [Candidatus Binatia bacterium]
MKYYPVFLRVAGRRCVVVGGGKVAEQKVQSLVRAGARVTVVSPEVTPRIAALAATSQIEHQRRAYGRGDLHGSFLAYAATDDEHIQQQVAREAEDAGVLLNVVDRPQLCDFIAPSVVERGDLVVATSTGGASPALAKRIRQDLQDVFGPEYDVALRLLRRLRDRLAGQSLPAVERQRILSSLANSPLLEYLRQRRTHEVDRLLAETVGDGVSLATLGMEIS